MYPSLIFSTRLNIMLLIQLKLERPQTPSKNSRPGLTGYLSDRKMTRN
jgi:hypothetical protein